MSPALTPQEVLAGPFEPLMDMPEAEATRQFLTSNTDLVPFYGLGMMDRDKMVSLVREVINESGDDELFTLIGAATNLRDGFREITGRADAVLVRLLACAHEVLDVEWADTLSDEERAWEAALAALEASPPGRQDEADPDASDERNCLAADAVIISTPAPDLAAFGIKLRLAVERAEGFCFPDAYTDALLADVERLQVAA